MSIKLIAFDMDGVLTKHPSSWRFVHDAIGVSNAQNLLKYREGLIPYSQFLDSDISLWVSKRPGIKAQDVFEILKRLPVREDLKETITMIRRKGTKAVIISGGISWLCDIINHTVSFDASYANEVLTDGDGTILPRGRVVVDPKRKDICLREVQDQFGFGSEETASVGDSNLDSTMFDLSSVGIFFSHHDKSGDTAPPPTDIIENRADYCIKSGRLMDIYRCIFMK